MKLSILTLAFALLSGSAAAQFSPISPRINPLAGMPSILPSPVISPLGRSNIVLPAPAMAPTLTLSAPAALAAPLAASPIAFAVVAVVPNPVTKITGYTVDARHENVRHPLNAIMPRRIARLGGAVEGRRTAADAPRDQDELDNLFDRGEPSAPVIPAARRDAVGDSRRISLPEWDLERELGL